MQMRKIYLILPVLALLFPCRAGLPGALENLEARNGTLEVVERGHLLLDASFQSAKPDWAEFDNFEKQLVRTFEKMGNTPAMVLRAKKQEKKDTAYKIFTRKVALTGEGNTLLLEIGCRADVEPNRDLGGNYSSRIFWFGKDGKELFSQPFCFERDAKSFFVSRFRFAIPAGAAAFSVRLAADKPNICQKEFVAINLLRVQRMGKVRTWPNSAAVTSPILSADDATGPAGTKITLSGLIPAGTEGKMQISVGTRKGTGLVWSGYTGPDGTKESFYRIGDTLSKEHAEARFIRYRLNLKTNGKKVVLKEVRVGRHTDKNWKVEEVAIPYVRNLTGPGENLKKPIRLEFETPIPLLWDTLTVTIDGQYVTNRFVRKGNIITYTPAKPFYNTLHVIRIWIRDALGQRVAVNRYFDFAPLPKENVSTLRDDGILLIDGKPFFPICMPAMSKGPWNNHSYDEGFRQLKEAGFNMSHTYMVLRTDEFYNEFLPAAEKYGIRLYISGPLRQNSSNVLPFVNTIRDERHWKSILIWYIADDTHLYMGKESAAEMSDAAHAADPSRLTAQSDTIVGLPGYAKFTDIYKMQCYPITDLKPSTTEKCVAAIIRDMKNVYAIRERENPKLFIWPTIQYFKGWKEWKRYPTPTELRAMTYAALIHGACGISWYTYASAKPACFGAANSPETWKVMTALVRELNVLYPALCARKAKDQPAIKVVSGPLTDPLGFDSVTGLLKHVDGKSYLMTVNSAMKPVKAEIRLPGLKGGKVLFENRSVTVKNGVLTDDFAPFAVHVYELKCSSSGFSSLIPETTSPCICSWDIRDHIL